MEQRNGAGAATAVPPVYPNAAQEEACGFLLDFDLLLRSIGDAEDTATSFADLGVLDSSGDRFVGDAHGREERVLPHEEMTQETVPCPAMRVPNTSFEATALSEQETPDMRSRCGIACPPFLHSEVNPSRLAPFLESDVASSIELPSFSPVSHPVHGHRTSASVPSAMTKKLAKENIQRKIAAPKRRNQNVSRKRQRDELQYLRAELSKLHNQLTDLLGEDAGAENSSSRAHQQADSVAIRYARRQSILRRVLFWKRASLREKQSVERAVVEKSRLRALIDDHLQVTKRLEAACMKHGCVEATFLSGLEEMDAPDAPIGRQPEFSPFSFLGKDLDAQYQRLRERWDAGGLTGFNAETVQDAQLKSDTSGTYVEHLLSRAVPFAPDAVARVIWQSVKSGDLSLVNGELKVRRVLGNTLYVTVTDTLNVHQRDCKMSIHAVVKRFVDRDRVVIVRDALIEIENHSSTRLVERGWHMIQAIAAGNKGAKSLATAPSLSQIGVRLAMEGASNVSEEDLADGALVRSILTRYHEKMLMLLQIIENQLIDEALGVRPSGGSNKSKNRLNVPERMR